MSRRVKPIVKDVKSEGAGNSAPGPAACIYRGPSAGNNSKEERSRSAERIQREPASPSEKDPAPATTLRRSKRILPPVHYYEDESDVSAWHISRFLELYSTTTSSDERGSAHISTSKSPGKRLKRASIKAKCSCPALTLHGAIGAPASTLNEEPSDDLEIAWNDYESDSADSWKTQEFVTLSFKELSEKQAK